MAIPKTQRNEELRKLFLEGKTLKEISEQYNISIQRVSQILYNLGECPNDRVEKASFKKAVTQKNVALRKLKARYKEMREKSMQERDVLHLQVLNLNNKLQLRDIQISQLKDQVKSLISAVESITKTTLEQQEKK